MQQVRNYIFVTKIPTDIMVAFWKIFLKYFNSTQGLDWRRHRIIYIICYMLHVTCWPCHLLKLSTLSIRRKRSHFDKNLNDHTLSKKQKSVIKRFLIWREQFFKLTFFKTKLVSTDIIELNCTIWLWKESTDRINVITSISCNSY